MAQEVTDAYIQTRIKKGDEGSDLLGAIFVPTLRNNNQVKLIGEERRVALEIPQSCQVTAHSAAGKGNPEEAAKDLVANLMMQAAEIKAKPVAMTDIIDSRTGDLAMLRKIAEAMKSVADKYHIAIINGENAILGDVIRGDANVSGTMISLLERGARVYTGNLPAAGTFRRYESGAPVFATFNPEGKFVVANSDGIGTKTRFYQRAGVWAPSINDFLAMILDDGAKIRGARVRAASGVFEVSGKSEQIKPTEKYMRERCTEMGIHGTLQIERGNLNAYREGVVAYNIGGTAVSVVSEEDLNNPLKPAAGEFVIAIRGKPNPRSNGITSKREVMIRMFGENWHETEVGKMFLEFLASPSTVLYPVFSELVNAGLATSVYHMSGGAYDGKFAKPLAKHNLKAELTDLFAPDWREVALCGIDKTSAGAAYGKYPMGNEGFVTTPKPDETIALIKEKGLEAQIAGKIVEGTGVELVAWNEERIYFSGVKTA
ncbi:hypothetical protein FJZ19_02580 [Candidatus Pacearchaeota archaeon]|nr:hypothetical protein [Candidatus Pacearchaeota archaeon]